jgi:rhodanese-related sulfurtransferase
VIPEIDIETFAEQLAAGATTIDVRETDEYVEAHVPGAHLFPLSEFSERLVDLPIGPLLIICKSGGRSMKAAEMLAASGRPEATNVAGGTMAWIASGRDTVSGPERG